MTTTEFTIAILAAGLLATLVRWVYLAATDDYRCAVGEIERDADIWDVPG